MNHYIKASSLLTVVSYQAEFVLACVDELKLKSSVRAGSQVLQTDPVIHTWYVYDFRVLVSNMQRAM